jgi:C-terminal peptidase prc
MKKKLLWMVAGIAIVFGSLYVVAWKAPGVFGASGGNAQQAQQSTEIDPRDYAAGAPEKFDGKFLYHRAWQAYNDLHRGLADPEARAKFAAEWEHKFDTTGDLNTIEGTYRAINQMRDALGERFDYVNPPTQAAAERNQQHSDLEGIGIPIGMKGMKDAAKDMPKNPTPDQVKAFLTIRPGHELFVADDPIQGGAAFGVLKKDDVIKAVDGVKVEGLTLEEAVSKIKGKAGTKVDITVERTENGVVTTPTFTFTRAHVDCHVVKLIGKDGKAVIKLGDFVCDTGPDEFALALEDANQNASGIVIDLRGNPGGIVGYAIDMISEVLPRGTIMVQVERMPGTDQVVYDETDLQNGLIMHVQRLANDPSKPNIEMGKRAPLLVHPNKPVVILINGNSASASEIFAGAMQANHRAKIVGTPSIGKGVGQIVVPLPYDANGHVVPPGLGGNLHVTSFEFLPGGKKSDWIGIIPDIQVERTKADIEAGKDPQLDAALAEIDKEVADNAAQAERAKQMLDAHHSCFDKQLQFRNKMDNLPVGAPPPEDEVPDCHE